MSTAESKRSMQLIAKPKLPGLAMCCTKHHEGNKVTYYSSYRGIYEKCCFGCGKENSVDIYRKVLHSATYYLDIPKLLYYRSFAKYL